MLAVVTWSWQDPHPCSLLPPCPCSALISPSPSSGLKLGLPWMCVCSAGGLQPPPVSFPACFPGCREEQRAPGEQHFFFFQVRQQLCAWFLSLFRADVAVVAVLDCSPGAQGKVMVVSGASSRVGSSAGGCWVEKEAWG